MHRYWKFAFPEDFHYTLNGWTDWMKRSFIVKAMDLADEQIEYLTKYVTDRSGQLWILASMGQEAIDRGEYFGELRIKDSAQFVSAIGFDRPFTDHLAMQPDFNFEFVSDEDAVHFANRVESIVDGDEKRLFFRVQRRGRTLNLGLGQTKKAIQSGFIMLGSRKIPFTQLGIQILQREHGTGYHQPAGIFIRYGTNVQANASRSSIESIDVRSQALEYLGLHAASKRATENAS